MRGSAPNIGNGTAGAAGCLAFEQGETVMNDRRLFSLAVLCLASFLLAGCTGGAVRNVERMNSFIGQPEEAVINSWGVPDKAYKLDNGTKVIAYTEISDRFDGPTSTVCMGTFPGDIGYSTCMGGPARRVRLSCERSFHIKSGKVVDWSQHGNNCPGGQKP